MIFIGIGILVTGKVRVTRKRSVRGWPAYTLAAIFLGHLPAMFIFKEYKEAFDIVSIFLFAGIALAIGLVIYTLIFGKDDEETNEETETPQ